MKVVGLSDETSSEYRSVSADHNNENVIKLQIISFLVAIICYYFIMFVPIISSILLKFVNTVHEYVRIMFISIGLASPIIIN